MAAINAAFVLGTQRTAAQDIEYLVGQLVEIAVRALSPGINDPFTAITCIDRLSSALSRFAQRDIPSPLRYDADHELRVIASGTTFAMAVDAAFGPIRRYGRSSAEVSLRLLDAIAVVGRAARRVRRSRRAHATRHVGHARRARRAARSSGSRGGDAPLRFGEARTGRTVRIAGARFRQS